MKWGNMLSVGHSSIDEEHQNLVRALKQLVNAISQSSESDNISEKIIIDAAEFKILFKCHCDNEENIMRSLGFAEIERHADGHRRIINLLQDLFQPGCNMVKLRMHLPIILKAVIDHMDHDDNDIRHHLKAKGLYGTF